MLSGIELARPDEYYIGSHAHKGAGPRPVEDSTFARFIQVEGVPVNVLGMEGIETFLCRRDGRYVIVLGATGMMMGPWAWGEAGAVAAALETVNTLGRDYIERQMVQWLETHPLPPRYKWAGHAGEGY